MEEVWKDVINYECHYKVSNLGNVKNIKKNKNLKIKSKNENGYLKVTLCKNGKQKTFTVHRLVASSFLTYYKEKLDVNHIDGNKNNNCVNNLELISHRDNIIHAYKNGLFNRKTINRVCEIMHNSRKRKIVRIKNDKIYKYESIKQASEFTKISTSNIRKYLIKTTIPRDKSIWKYV